MTHNTTTLNKLTAWSGFAMLAFTLCLPLGTTRAGEMVLTGTNVQQKVEATWVQIGEDESHGIGTFQTIGVTLQGDGEVATFTSKGTYEWKNGIGTHQGYLIKTYADGSTSTQKYEGTSKPAGETMRVWEGRLIFTDGTGRFEGLKGEGTYNGTRHSNGMGVTPWEAKVTVPD